MKLEDASGKRRATTAEELDEANSSGRRKGKQSGRRLTFTVEIEYESKGEAVRGHALPNSDEEGFFAKRTGR